YQDRGGVLWVGTRGGGASHWNPRSWLLGHYRSASFRDMLVNAFADDGAGKVWVGTLAGLIEVDARSGRERRYGRSADSALRLTDERIMALLYDRRGVLWVGTMSGGLDRLDLTAGTAYNYRADPDEPTTLAAKGVMSRYQERRGKPRGGTFRGGPASIGSAKGPV